MEIENKYKYFAFISYKREDEEWAKKLQYKLEHYKLPSNLNGRTDLPKEIRPIFRDQSDLAGGVLADEINDALERSKFLIVICSPRAAQSEWVGKEVQAFLNMGRTDKIIPFIIGGTAHAQNPQDECFPLSLREMPPHQELLGVNINEMGQDAAAVKVVAQMFGLKFDELWQRHERETRKKRRFLFSGITIFALLVLGIAGLIWRQNWKLMENQSRFVAEKANDLIEKGNPYLAQRILLEILPKNTKCPSKPCTIEAENALRNAWNQSTEILNGHPYEVYSAVFSPDGERIVSASVDGTILMWDAITGEVLSSFEGAFFCQPAFSPDGNQLISKCMGRGISRDTIRIWDTKTGEELNAMGGYFFNSVAYSPDGSLILSTSNDTIRIWDVRTGEKLNSMGGHNGRVIVAAFSPDGNHIVSASSDSTARIWDAKTGEILNVLRGHAGGVMSVTFSPDGNRIVSASSDSTARIWDAKTGEILNVLRGHADGVKHAAFSPDGKRIASISWDETILIWDAETGRVQKVLCADEINSFAFSPNSKFIVGASRNGTITIWNLETEGLVFFEGLITLKGHTDAINTIAFSADGNSIITASKDKTVRIWDFKIGRDFTILLEDFIVSWPVDFVIFSPNGKRIVSTCDDDILIWDVEMGMIIDTLKGHRDEINSVSVSPDGNRIVSASRDSTIRIWDAETGNILINLKRDFGFDCSAVFSPDNKHVVSTQIGDSIALIRIWDVETGEDLCVLEGHNDAVISAVFSPNGNHIISASLDNTIRVWDAETGKVLDTLFTGRFSQGITPLSSAFSPDGKRFVSISSDNTVHIWDAETGEELKRLVGHTKLVCSAVFSPDGRHVVSASNDGTIRVWDAETGKELNTLQGHNQAVRSAVFSPDGKNILSASSDGTIRIWSFPPLQELIDQTRERFKDRPLTPEERRMYYLE